jgi:hypothetical protein
MLCIIAGMSSKQSGRGRDGGMDSGKGWVRNGNENGEVRKQTDSSTATLPTYELLYAAHVMLLLLLVCHFCDVACGMFLFFDPRFC